MMKAAGVLGGLFVLLGLSYVHASLLVACTTTTLLARVDRVPLVSNVTLEAQDLTLGSNCSVSTVESGYFEFLYVLSSCDIKIYDQDFGMIIESSITYNSPHFNFYVTIPISCSVPRKSYVKASMKRSGAPCRVFTVVEEFWPLTGGILYSGVSVAVPS
ncbi:oocyte-secreted protein 1-like [Octodon degus]|uniref:Oocyte-secreted protein 1-like n=1 Tax=Octodon degus TaxID=10160 RepID=A0A6P6DX41_OCTDE|nr:oocyte-secreted protein 1-like [Octodon degus]XP_023564546.1 oocyte-secreted protein 1-like [Octodon degus]